MDQINTNALKVKMNVYYFLILQVFNLSFSFLLLLGAVRQVCKILLGI